MDIFQLQGSYSTKPTLGIPSGFPSLVAPIQEQMALQNKTIAQYQLDTDAPVTVEFGGVTNCNALIVKCSPNDIVLGLTSTAGVAAVPVGTFYAQLTITDAVTAITLTRQPGLNTVVEVFLGERA